MKKILKTNVFFLLISVILINTAKAQKSTVSIKGNSFYMNEKPTYEGRFWKGNKIEGLLMNSRMVQGIFDDLKTATRDTFAYSDTKKWDADRNNREFVQNMALWKSYGLNSFTLNMQGGSPFGYGNFDFYNPGYKPDGSLDKNYMNRLENILKKADDLNMVVILGLFYFGQDQRLTDEKAIINATDNTINWLHQKKFRNVIIEIANESGHKAYHHEILSPLRIPELINRVKNNNKNGYRYLVSTSFMGRTLPNKEVVAVADFILIHGNGAKNPEQIQTLIDGTKQVLGSKVMPIVINEDDHFDFDKENFNMLVAVKNYVSWGFFDYRLKGETDVKEGYQTIPVDWGINSDRKKAFFNKLKEITGGDEK